MKGPSRILSSHARHEREVLLSFLEADNQMLFKALTRKELGVPGELT